MVFLVSLPEMLLLDFNDTACTGLGYERHELLGCVASKIVSGTVEELRASHAGILADPGRGDSVVRIYKHKNGRTFETEVLRRVIDSPAGRIMVINARDLTERKLAEKRQALYVRFQETIAQFGESALGKRESGELVQDAMQSIAEALRTDAVAYVERGPSARELVVCGLVGAAAQHDAAATHYSPGDAIEAALERGELVITDASSAPLPFGWAKDLRCSALVPVRSDLHVQGVLCVLSASDAAFGAQESKFLVTAASVLSAGLRRIDSEGRLAFLAQFDSLTGLPNRALLSDRFLQMIVQAKRHGTQLGVLFIDLDDFKTVNDTLGHAAGDELLAETGRRLQAVVRPGDTVARISGDEFAVILNDLARPEDAALVAQKIIDALASPLQLCGQEVFATASIGIAAFPADGDDTETLLGAADAAMYRAKESGRNSYQFFTAEINQRSRMRAQLGNELRRALERDEFALAYQPKFDLATGRPCAAEALLRWHHPERGIVSPAEFIPVLEETGLIIAVGEWVLRRACRDVKAWQASGMQIPVAVNLSARQFRQDDLGANIRRIVNEAGIDPRLIELELTESQLMHDPEQAERTMRSLCDIGFRVAIDDFGTGYSSLSYLTRFPVSALKIDRSFVADVLKVGSHAAIVRTIIDMAHTLGFIVIAEGVETEAQAVLLRSLGCEQAQGYFFARPMPEAQMVALFAASLSDSTLQPEST
jgi:diguanylate cyclase (GGDEF)-like protein/PAS domain S-box-containing protein